MKNKLFLKLSLLAGLALGLTACNPELEIEEDHDNYTFADLMALANSDGEPLEIQPTI